MGDMYQFRVACFPGPDLSIIPTMNKHVKQMMSSSIIHPRTEHLIFSRLRYVILVRDLLDVPLHFFPSTPG